MRYHFPTMTATLAVILAACSDTGPIQPPQAQAPTLAAEERRPEGKRVEIHDACDPDSFNAVLGEGSCTRAGGLRFSRFIELLTKNGSVESWRFTPSVVEGRVGQKLLATNLGGEVHTFTEVEEFGGGIVPLLNQLSHNTEVAPECQALAPDDFLAPGATDSDDEIESGTELYQCCIHPWMRTVVRGLRG
jgi:hypothetical protein